MKNFTRHIHNSIFCLSLQADEINFLPASLTKEKKYPGKDHHSLAVSQTHSAYYFFTTTQRECTELIHTEPDYRIARMESLLKDKDLAMRIRKEG